MRQIRNVGPRWIASAALAAVLAMPGTARAGKLSWLDDVVKEVVREAEAGGKVAARGADEAIQAGKSGGRLFVREAADEGLDVVARHADDLAKMGRTAGAAPTEALLQSRFSKLLKAEPEVARTFSALAPAEKRLVVEMGETAQRLARRYPGQAEPMIRSLGTEGLSAVRVFGDDVAEGLAKEGASSLGVLRKTGRTGWDFFTTKVLPNKGKLAAAGVLALFLADPDKFVDTAGRATQYAVEQFTRAGVSLAGAIGGGAVRGLGGTFGALLAAWGIDSGMARVIGIGGAVLVVLISVMILVGAPIRWLLRPFGMVARLVRGRVLPHQRQVEAPDFMEYDRPRRRVRKQETMLADLIVEDHDGQPVLFVKIQRVIGQECLRGFMTDLEVGPASVRFGILVDPATIRIYRHDSRSFHPLVAELDAVEVLRRYSDEFAGERTAYGTARVFHIYLTGLVDAWLSDLAFSWKGGEMPQKDIVRSIGLLPQLEGRSIINQDAIRGYPVR